MPIINTLSIPKPGLKTAVIEALYNEILTNSNNYYYFLGKTLEYGEGDVLEAPDATIKYETETRNEMIFLKKITTADVSYIIPRYNWESGEVFDMYDDYIGHIINFSNITFGASSATVTATNHGLVVGDVVNVYGVTPSGYNGTHTITAAAANSFNFSLTIGNPGPWQGGGTIITCSTLGSTSIESSKFYCVTDEFHVYKCLDNNYGAPSTVKPYSTTHRLLKLSDGYTWKYMYTIPVSSRNKFLTLTDMPVTTAIKNQYYSRGSITSVTINEYGTEYDIDDTSLEVFGNGRLTDNGTKIIGVSINTPGTGYVTPPTVIIDPPYTFTAFETEKDYLLGQYVEHENNIYEVVSPGTSGLSSPTHTSSEPVYNGTVALKWAGRIATATATLDGDAVDTIVLDGIIGYINITNPGYGYSDDPLPTITISGDGVDADVIARVINTRIAGVTIVNRGTDYTNASVTIDPPRTDDTAWVSQATVALNNIISNSGKYYQVTTINSSTAVTFQDIGDTVTLNSHGFVNGNTIKFASIASTTGISTNTVYYIVNKTDNTFKVSTSLGGSALPLTTNGTGTIVKLGTSAPTHTVGTATNGNVTLTYVAADATAAVELYYGYGYNAQPTVIVSQSPVKTEIIGFEILEQGEGYAGPAVTFTDTGDLVTRTAHGFVNGDTVRFSSITTTTGISINTTYYVINKTDNTFKVALTSTGSPISLTNNGTGNLSPLATISAPNLSVEDGGLQAEVSLTVVGGEITGVVIDEPGYGYTIPPTITITSISGSGFIATVNIGISASASVSTQNTKAKLIPIIENGQIVSVIAQDPGIGYTTASVVAVMAGHTGIEAQLVANLSVGDLNSNQANIELLAIPGTVDAIKMTNRGSGYTSGAAIITIDGDGTGAAAEATVVGGVITKITMTNYGSGYTKAFVTINAPNEEDGVQATARTIVSPPRGHSSNSIIELYAKDISLYSAISNEKNQGFTVSNDYRQLGILKNPQSFSATTRFNNTVGSACYSVAVNYTGVTTIDIDSLVLDSNDHEFRVVAVTLGVNKATLLLQSLDNEPIVAGQNLFYDGDTMTVTNVTAPSVNKYSGSLIFIDNRNAFLPSSEETVSIKTAIRF